MHWLTMYQHPGLWVKRWAETRGDKYALIDAETERTCTYGELNAKSNTLANNLVAKGYRKGDRLVVVLENSIEMVEVYLACAKTGLIFIPLSPRITPLELKAQITRCKPRGLITTQDMATHFKNLGIAEIYVTPSSDDPRFENYTSLFKPPKPSYPELEWCIEPEDLHLILYTGGTTGRPKGCMLPYRKTFYNTLNDHLVFGLTENDTYLCSLPLFHSGGLNIILVPTLYAGGTVVLMKRIRGDPARILENLEKYKATAFLGVAYHAKLINSLPDAEKRYKLECLRYWGFGGEPIPYSVVEALQRKWPHVAVMTCYGTTETSLAIALPPTRKSVSMFKLASSLGRMPAGKVMFYSEVKVVSENGKEVGRNEVGEVLIKGPTVFSGYWEDPEKTREAIDKDGWFHTGDLALIDEDGYIYVVDRRSHIIKSGGEKISAAEVEEVISQHHKVADVAVIGAPDEKWGERPVAFIVPKEGERISYEEIRKFCEGKLAKYKIPDKIKVVAELPRTGPGKVAKWVLKQRYLDEK